MYPSAHRALALLLLLAGGLIATGCDPDVPTEPGGGSTAPRITSVVPQAPLAAIAPQRLQVRGERFLTGLSMSITMPSGETIPVPGSDIQALQSTSFEVTVVLATPGNHLLRLQNATGEASDPFSLTVQGTPTDTQPIISSIIPGALIRGPNPQFVTVQGTNFAFGLTVNVIDPDGQVAQLSGGPISGFTPTGFQLTMIFSKVGTYSFRVVNPTGETSNSVTVSAGL